MTESFAAKGLGEFRHVVVGVVDGDPNTSFRFQTALKFLDPKDQFKFELLGGDQWRWKLMVEWMEHVGS
jgi:hypothetical protein